MSPLTKRFPREFKNNLGKYLGIFAMLVIAIGLTSGFLAAASSISKIAGAMDETYLMEDAHFTTSFEASKSDLAAAKKAAEDSGAGTTRIYNMNNFELSFTSPGAPDGCTARVYAHRTQINLPAYCEGNEPTGENEIALDRVFANNSKVHVGDTVQVGGRDFTVSGIVTLSDYSVLFEKNSDFTLNAVTFTVAEVSEEGYEALAEELTPLYTYSVRFDNRELTDAQRTDAESEMMSALTARSVSLDDFVDKDSNQPMTYAVQDIDGDSTMWETLMMLLIVIMAFMFVVLTSSTIEDESAIIGTLLASGWRKRELVVHYSTLPCLVGVVGAVVGNVVGYIFMAEPMQNLYYNSYSFPPYHAIWDWNVFLLTTVAPLVLLIAITVLGLAHKMRCTPLQFLRHETGRSGNRHAFALPERLPFPTRFRLRIFLKSIGNYVTLFFGICFASMLLLFGLAIMPTMTNYASSLAEGVPANHLYTLKAPLEIDGSASDRAAWKAANELTRAPSLAETGMTAGELLDALVKVQSIDEDGNPVNTQENSAAAIAQAEKFAAASLDYERPGDAGVESVTVYGVQPDSRYWSGLSLEPGQCAASGGMFEKFGFEEGQEFSLYDKYEDESYTVSADVRYGSDSTMAVYMHLDDFNELFGNDADYFNGYASDEPLALDERYLAADTTPESMNSVADQMTNSMGDMMDMLMAVAVMIFLVFIYLLTKTVIDRSARAISYMKVFGYADKEINRLYIRSITVTVAISLVASLPVIIGSLSAIFKGMLMEYNGNIAIYVPTEAMVQTVLIGLATYAVVAFLHTRRIKKVPLALALKVQE